MAPAQLSGISDAAGAASASVLVQSQLQGSSGGTGSAAGQILVPAKIAGIAEAFAEAQGTVTVLSLLDNDLLAGALVKVALPLFVATVREDVFVAKASEPVYSAEVELSEHNVTATMREPLAKVG